MTEFAQAVQAAIAKQVPLVADSKTDKSQSDHYVAIQHSMYPEPQAMSYRILEAVRQTESTKNIRLALFSVNDKVGSDGHRRIIAVFETLAN